MCDFDPKNDSRYMDPCMVPVIKRLNDMGINTISCCCGHGKYRRTIIVQSVAPRWAFEWNTGILFHDRKHFYRKDEDGYYFIPEIEERR